MKIGIIDLDTGNLGSLISAMDKLNIKYKICRANEDLIGIKKIILPGVGAFKDFMKKIKQKGIDKNLILKSKNNISILGVCLGFQILFNRSTEHGNTKGLGIVEGKIDSFKSINSKIKIPHVGWNSCIYVKKNPLFNEINNFSDFYFTHSYFLKEYDVDDKIAETEYFNNNFVSAIAKKNIYGVQFHPEKSQINGLKLLKNFMPDYRYTKNFIDLWSIDEIIMIDVSKEKKINNFIKLVRYFSKNCFVPITIGGGIKNKNQADLFFKNGADKILLGSASIDNFSLIEEISKQYGNQSIVQSLDLKKIDKNKYKIMKNSGVSTTEKNPIELCKNYLNSGVGEILINNINNDGSLLGYDLDLVNSISNKINCPILVLGGAGKWEHILDLFTKTNAEAACTQNIYHFTEESILSVKNYLKEKKIQVRL